MGDISIIARRLESGKRVQYGWSGNGGYYDTVGYRLLSWYNNPEKVEYLFNLGQLGNIGKPGSENGSETVINTHYFTNEPHWLGKSEREIFSKIAFVDYGYFYDLNNTWYYVIPGPFRIKIPLLYISQHLDEKGYEFKECDKIDYKLVEYILNEYYLSDTLFQNIIKEKYPQGIDKIRSEVFSKNKKHCYLLWDNYREIFDYFDDWVVVKTSEDKKEITGFLIKKKQEEERIETINW